MPPLTVEADFLRAFHETIARINRERPWAKASLSGFARWCLAEGMARMNRDLDQPMLDPTLAPSLQNYPRGYPYQRPAYASPPRPLPPGQTYILNAPDGGRHTVPEKPAEPDEPRGVMVTLLDDAPRRRRGPVETRPNPSPSPKQRRRRPAKKRKR